MRPIRAASPHVCPGDQSATPGYSIGGVSPGNCVDCLDGRLGRGKYRSSGGPHWSESWVSYGSITASLGTGPEGEPPPRAGRIVSVQGRGLETQGGHIRPNAYREDVLRVLGSPDFQRPDDYDLFNRGTAHIGVEYVWFPRHGTQVTSVSLYRFGVKDPRIRVSRDSESPTGGFLMKRAPNRLSTVPITVQPAGYDALFTGPAYLKALTDFLAPPSRPSQG